MNRYRLIFVASVCLLASCGKESWGPLHRYNDVWRGELRISGGASHSVTATVYVTEWDEGRSLEEGEIKKAAYLDLAFATGERLAGYADVNHYDMRDLTLTEPVYSPIPGREFLQVHLEERVRYPGPLSETPTPEETVYAKAYDALASEAGLDVVDHSRTSLVLAAEKVGDRLTGILFKRDSLTGIPPKDYDVLGTLELTRTHEPPTGSIVSSKRIETDRFVFETDTSLDETRSWSIRLR